MSDKIRIESDGTSIGTKVFIGDEVIKGITKIEFPPIVPGGLISARITFMSAEFILKLKEAEIVSDDSEIVELIKGVLLKL
jgi:hypothetical protein